MINFDTCSSYDPFASSFTRMKIRYVDYRESLKNNGYDLDSPVNSSMHANVFIDLESVFLNLSMIQDLEKKLVLQRAFQDLFVSHILNLAAHYKRFFNNGYRSVSVFLYYTDFDSSSFYEQKYNDEFRSYYLNKYNSNPKFVLLTENLKNDILPDAKMISEFIPNVYLIKATNIEGSLVPLIISESYNKTCANFIISEELYNTQYTLMNGFFHHLIRAGSTARNIYSSIPQYLTGITRKSEEEIKKACHIFSYYGTYTSLLSCIGDRSRAVGGIRGVGTITLEKLFLEAVFEYKMELETANDPDTLAKIFDSENTREEFKKNYLCTYIPLMYERLTSSDKNTIVNQIVDRSDFNSVIELNKTRFATTPLKLEFLF